MGGHGSGRKRTNDVETKYRKLDIRLLAREGALAAGCECSVQWTPSRPSPPKTEQRRGESLPSLGHTACGADRPSGVR